MYNIPNLLTLSRIAVIPLIFISVYFPWAWYAYFAAILFIAASITDYFDGYLARLYNQTSAFGRLLDPIADKLLVGTALVVILAKADTMVSLTITYIPIFVILCREILVSGLREFLREVNVGMPVTRLAKWKTGFQMTALSMMLLRGFWYWGQIGEFLLWIAGILTFITGYQYFQKSLDYVKEAEAAQNGSEKKEKPAAKTKTATAKKTKTASVKEKKTAKTAKTEKSAKKTKAVKEKTPEKPAEVAETVKKEPAKKSAPKKATVKKAAAKKKTSKKTTAKNKKTAKK